MNSDRKDFDAIIIGAGHNGLTCAAYLARAGMRVKVLEARPVIGGAAVTEEFAPGSRNSSCSYVVSLLNPKVIRELELVRYGLEILPRACDGFFPQPDGTHLIYGPDGQDFMRQLEARAPGEGAGYERFDRDLGALVPVFRELMLTTPPNLDGNFRDIVNAALALNSARKLDLRQRALLIDILTTSAADFLARYFRDEAVKASFGYLAAVGSLISPYAGGTAYILLDHVVGEANGVRGMWGHAKGGMGAISNAIARSGEAHGVSIETGAPVREILVERGTVKGVATNDGRIFRAKRIVSAIHPKLLFGKLLDAALIPSNIKEDIGHYVTISGTFRMNVALDELPDFKSLPGKKPALQHTGSIIICPSLAYLDKAYDDAKGGDWSKAPMIEMCIPSTIDPTLAPEGRHVASLFCQHFHPYLSGGRDWDDHREEAADLIIKTVDQYAPNFSRAVTARKILSPKDLEREFGLVGGCIFHGSLKLNQVFSMRPAAGIADYRGPVKGLYMCAAGTHPGGGVSGVPGHNAAREIIRDARGWFGKIRPRAAI
jgi:phytoene dehydrogenase-like protein